MKRNFKVRHGIEVEKSGIIMDLHNCYDLHNIVFSLAEGKLMIVFSRNECEPSGIIALPTDVVISFHGIRHLEISDGIFTGMAECLDEIGFKHPDDKNLDWLIDEEKASETDHLVLGFMNNEYIRIDCETADLN